MFLRLACALCLILPPAALAGVERVEILDTAAVAGGRAFGDAGPYVRMHARMHYVLDPTAPGNVAIVDLEYAPRDADGLVRFTGDLYLMRPLGVAPAGETLLVEVPNRGGKAMVRYFNRSNSRSRDPISESHIGDGFLMRRGFSLAWVGWQFDVSPGDERLAVQSVFATATPEPITGLVRADRVFDAASRVFPLGHRGHWAYPVADYEDPRNVLTVRDGRHGKRETLRRDTWRFAKMDNGLLVPDPRHIHHMSGFQPGRIYEAVYVARDPAVVGLGFAAMRDTVIWLRHSPDSLARPERVLGFGVSQTGRFLRQFLYQGFNLDPADRKVFDGVLIHTAGGGRGSFNHRFGQPSRDAHPYSAFFYPTDIFPFTGRSQTDAETGLSDGLFEKLGESDAMPKVFFTNTGYEYWGRSAGLIHLSVDGTQDFPPRDDVRIYHIASAQHYVDAFPPRQAETRYVANPLDFFWLLRGLLVRLEDWVANEAAPPASRYPALRDDSLVAPEDLAFPEIPGVEVPRKAHLAYRADYGPRFRSDGIVDTQPPELGKPFPVRVPQVDATGNERGGVRMPEVEAPLATYAPWNWRAADIGAGDELANFRGSFFPLPAETVDGDSRESIAQRYPDRDAYLSAYTAAAEKLIAGGYLLSEDLPGLQAHARALWALTTGSPNEDQQP